MKPRFLALLLALIVLAPRAYAQPGTSLGVFASVNSPVSIRPLSDGTYLVPSYFGGYVERLSVDGTSLGIFASGIYKPNDVIQLPNGNVWVAEWADMGGAIRVYQEDGTYLGYLPSSPAGPANLRQLADGSIMVSVFSWTNGSLYRFASDGTYLGVFATGFVGGPYGIVELPDGSLVVTEGYSHLVKHFASDGTYLGLWGAGHNLPVDAVLLPDNTVLIVNYGGGSVTRFTTDGTPLGTFATGLAVPYSVGMLPDGTLLYVDYGGNAILRVEGVGPPANACTDPATAPSYAGGYVLNSAQSRAFVRVEVPQGGATFAFYNTSNLVVGDPEADTESGTPLPGLTRSGNTFAFAAALEPTEAYFPVSTAGAGSHVAFFLKVTDTCGRTVDVDPDFEVMGLADDALTGFALAAAQPNPVAAQATIHFSLDEAGPARLVIYDVLGREVAQLVEASLEVGAQAARFDATRLPAGLYVYRLEAGGRSLSGTLTVAH